MSELIKYIRQNAIVLYFLVILLASFTTYFWNYQSPALSQWDEVFHVSSGEKYVQGTMFMELHPPLGKLLIAAGETILQPNPEVDKTKFTQVDSIAEFPAGFSFAGYRFFPALLGMLLGPMLFLVLYHLIRNSHVAAAFSTLVVFDNALILQSRAAMLESTQLFFHLGAILCFVVYLNQSRILSTTADILPKSTSGMSLGQYAGLGALVGFGLATKHTGAILVLLPVFWVVLELRRLVWKGPGRQVRFMTLVGKFLASLAACALVYVGVFVIHTQLSTKVSVESSNNAGYYKASDTYRRALDQNEARNLSLFPIALTDNLRYMSEYNQGVPKLDLCRKDAAGNPTENGSYPMTWPFMNKSINFRWEQLKVNAGDRTDIITNDDYNTLSDQEKSQYYSAVRYSQLIGNPIVWLIGLVAIILSLVLIVARVIFGLPVKNRSLFAYIVMFSLLYLGYMGAVLQIDRVLYLYHYFVPLLFTLILAGLLFMYQFGHIVQPQSQLFNTKRNSIDQGDIQTLDAKALESPDLLHSDTEKTEYYRLQRQNLYGVLVTGVALIIISFYFFSPLTYFQPLTTEQFMQRNWFPFWGLRVIN